MPNIGPVTLQNIKAIIDRIDTVAAMEEIEALGRAMGIPEDKLSIACRVVEIEISKRIQDELTGLRAEQSARHQEGAKQKKEQFHLFKKIVSSVNGILKSEE